MVEKYGNTTNRLKYAFFSLFVFFCFNLAAENFSSFYDDFFSSFSNTTSGNEGLTVFRSFNIPIGGNAEALGSAFTALSNDIGFFEYNPAASSSLKNTEFAVFHNSWIADSSLDTIAYTTRFNHFGTGTYLKCFYVPFTEYNIFGERVSRGYYSESTAAVNLSYNFFSGYNFKGIAAGINLKTAFRSVPDYADDETNEVIPGSGLEQSALAGAVDLGLKTSFNFLKFYISRETNFNIGVSLMNLGAALTGFGDEVKADDPLPTKVQGGFSWQPIIPLILTFEFQQPINLAEIEKSEHWAAGTGCFVQITDFFAVAGGFQLKGANPRFSLGSEFLVQKAIVNLNYTFDLTSSLNPLNRVSLSAKILLGDRGRKEKQNKIDELYLEGLNLYAQGHLEEAIQVWEQILLMDRRFDPAIESIATAKETIRLQKRIKDIQTLD